MSFWRGSEAKQRAKEGATNGVRLAAELVKARSQAVVPLEEGTLMRSATVEVDPSVPAAAIGYDTVYAKRQHEELNWRHAPGRKAKYLEGPFRESEKDIREIVNGQVRRALR